MSNYTKTTDFAAKDALTAGNPAKAGKGTEVNAEFVAIQTAVNSKEDAANKNVASGYAGLNSSTRIIDAQLGFLRASATVDLPSIGAGSGATATISVIGAAVGDVVAVGTSISVNGLIPFAQCYNTDTVDAGFFNPTGVAINPGSCTFKVVVFK